MYEICTMQPEKGGDRETGKEEGERWSAWGQEWGREKR
jgi:hypothetical protein